MRFLVDNALSRVVAQGRSNAGHDAVHVRDLGLGDAEDSLIFDRAAAEDRVALSADTDFGTLLALRQEIKPSVLLFRGGSPRRPADQLALILANLPAIEAELIAGAIVVVEPGRVRIRSLPISGNP
jgi:predicted nuclease of predicted toxin-antitoxin system